MMEASTRDLGITCRSAVFGAEGAEIGGPVDYIVSYLLRVY